MHFAQHLIISWFVAEKGGAFDLPERRLITWAGILPDADVAPYAAAVVYNYFSGNGIDSGATGWDALSQAFDHAFVNVHQQVHHHFTHGVVFIAATFAAVALWCRFKQNRLRHRALKTAVYAAFTSFLHCICDVIGSGPSWPIYPFWPFSNYAWGCEWSLKLSDWRNMLLVLALLGCAYWYAKKHGRSPLEAFSRRLDAAFVRMIRSRQAPE